MKISTKDYIDNQNAWAKRIEDWATKYLDAEIAAMRRAVDKYSNTTDEWKTLHNGLQRQMAEQGKQFVTKDELSQLVKMLWAVFALVAALAVAVYVKK